MENHHLQWILPLKIVFFFHSYAKLPEATHMFLGFNMRFPWVSYGFGEIFMTCPLSVWISHGNYRFPKETIDFPRLAMDFPWISHGFPMDPTPEGPTPRDVERLHHSQLRQAMNRTNLGLVKCW